MNDPHPHPRPPRVTFASIVGSFGCAILIGSLFGTMGRLRSSETRESLAELLADPPLRGSGISVDELVSILRGLAFVSGALAAAGFVLAVFVAQRHHGARIGFGVVAGLLLLTIPAAGLTPLLPAAAAVMLWGRDARAWFGGGEVVRSAGPDAQRRDDDGAGRPRGDASYGTSSDRGAPQPPSPWTAPAPTAGEAGAPVPGPAASPFGTPDHLPGHGPDRDVAGATTPTAPLHPGAGEQPVGPYGGDWMPQTAAPDRRPTTVTAAVVLACLGSGLTLLGGLGIMLALVAVPGAVEEAVQADDQFDELSLSLDQVVAVLWGTGALLVLWSLAALVLALLTLRRHQVARVLLAVSSVMAALFSLVAILSGIAVVTLLLAGSTAVLLFTGGANAWFSRRPSPRPDPSVSGPTAPW